MDKQTTLRESKKRKTVTVEVEAVVVGRDKRVVTPPDVEKLSSLGCKDSEIASWFGISEDTLRYNFLTELMRGRESLKHSLRRAQISLALSGNPTMLIWLGRNLLGQSENPLDSNENAPLPWHDDEI